MGMCKFCGVAMSWGQERDGKWIPLIPLGEEGDLPRTYQDENGKLRAGHRAVCTIRGGPPVLVTRLAKPVAASDMLFAGPTVVDQETGEILPAKSQKRQRRQKKHRAAQESYERNIPF